MFLMFVKDGYCNPTRRFQFLLLPNCLRRHLSPKRQNIFLRACDMPVRFIKIMLVICLSPRLLVKADYGDPTRHLQFFLLPNCSCRPQRCRHLSSKRDNFFLRACDMLVCFIKVVRVRSLSPRLLVKAGYWDPTRCFQFLLLPNCKNLEILRLISS